MIVDIISFVSVDEIWLLNHDRNRRGACVAQAVERPTLDQVTRSRFMISSPALGTLCWQLGPWNLLWILYLPFSLPLPCSRSVSIKNLKKRYISFILERKTTLHWDDGLWSNSAFTGCLTSIRYAAFRNLC